MIYPVDSDIQRLNNWGLDIKSFVSNVCHHGVCFVPYKIEMAKKDEFLILLLLLLLLYLWRAKKKNAGLVTDIEVLVTKPLTFQVTTRHLRSKEPAYYYICRIFVYSLFSSICLAIREHCFSLLRSLRGG